MRLISTPWLLPWICLQVQEDDRARSAFPEPPRAAERRWACSDTQDLHCTYPDGAELLCWRVGRREQRGADRGVVPILFLADEKCFAPNSCNNPQLASLLTINGTQRAAWGNHGLASERLGQGLISWFGSVGWLVQQGSDAWLGNAELKPPR